MLNKKMLFGLLLATLGLNMSVVAGNSYSGMQVSQYDVRDYNGRTDLMNFVIDQEDVVGRLEHYISYYASHRYADSAEYYSKQLRDVKYATGPKIVALMQSGANFNAQDNDGNTALSFARTREMYNILRENGAQFQFGVWMNIYRTELALASIVTVGTVVYLNQEGILTADTVSAFAKDTYAAMAILATQVQETLTPMVAQAQEGLNVAGKAMSDFVTKTTPVVQDALANSYKYVGESLSYAGDNLKAGCVAMNKSFSQAFPTFDKDSFRLGYCFGALYMAVSIACENMKYELSCDENSCFYRGY